MNRRFTTTVLVSTLAVAMWATKPAEAGDTITAVSWGGSFQAMESEAYFQPYMKETGNTIVEDTWNGEIAKVRAMVETNNVSWDLIVADYAHAIIGCDEGFLEHIDVSALGDPNDWLPGTVNPCGVSSDVFSLMFAYRSDVFTGDTPKTVADVFDVKRFPGKRGFRKNPKWMLEQVLMADGVAPDKVYDVLGTDEGLQRAFDKLTSIKDDVIFWETNAQAPQLLADKEVAIVELFNGRMYNAIEQENQPFVPIWDSQVYAPNTWIIPKGANKAAAMSLLKWIMRPQRLAEFSNRMPYAPARLSAVQYVDKQMVSHLPTAPENFTKALGSNEEWWADHEEEIAEKFNTWLAAW